MVILKNFYLLGLPNVSGDISTGIVAANLWLLFCSVVWPSSSSSVVVSPEILLLKFNFYETSLKSSDIIYKIPEIPTLKQNIKFIFLPSSESSRTSPAAVENTFLKGFFLLKDPGFGSGVNTLPRLAKLSSLQ